MQLNSLSECTLQTGYFFSNNLQNQRNTTNNFAKTTSKQTKNP